jgi:hypothetical protein
MKPVAALTNPTPAGPSKIQVQSVEQRAGRFPFRPQCTSPCVRKAKMKTGRKMPIVAAQEANDRLNDHGDPPA